MSEPLERYRLAGAIVAFAVDGAAPEAPPALGELLAVPIRRRRQVHGADVALAHTADAERPGDGLIATDTGTAAAILTADCVPLLLADERGRVAAAIHAGWRGVAAGIVVEAIRQIETQTSVRPAELDGLLGPAAGGCCYEVGDEVVSALRAVAPDGFDEQRWLRPGRGDRPHVDLRSLVCAQLESLGVTSGAVRSHSSCTICDPRWPSYRRQGAGAGRLWSAIRIA